MPHIPGILSLCCLAFSQVANMRVSSDGTEYIGAIFGLGIDVTGDPMYPDEDIEHQFDIALTNADLEHINKVISGYGVLFSNVN